MMEVTLIILILAVCAAGVAVAIAALGDRARNRAK
jgi:hypothetical protein